MNTHELAKELRGLALHLEALTYEAREQVAHSLDLERRARLMQRRDNKFAPAPLTIAAVRAALNAATAKPALSVTLRKDVYERRVEKLSERYTREFQNHVRAARTAPAGVRFAASFCTKPPDGVRSIYDATPRHFANTAINAEVAAWEASARCNLYTIVPGYSYRSVELYVERSMDGATDHTIWDARDRINGAIDRWTRDNTFFLCDVDAGGQVIRVNGLDPAPFIELLKQVSAGNPDPLNVLQSTAAAP